jgi:hypothetical protein
VADKRKPIQPFVPAIRAHELTQRERCGPMPVGKIVSGGQTGADRAALDFALAHGIPHGGWCPRGRLAEDGALERSYELKETPEEEYGQRTEWNVRDSEGTVIFSIAPNLTGGSRLTAELAARLGKPCLHLSEVRDRGDAASRLESFVRDHNIRTLNVGGPRASNEPEVARFVIETLEKLFDKPRTSSRKWSSYAR